MNERFNIKRNRKTKINANINNEKIEHNCIDDLILNLINTLP